VIVLADGKNIGIGAQSTPHTKMITRGLYVFKYASKLGHALAHKGVTLERKIG